MEHNNDYIKQRKKLKRKSFTKKAKQYLTAILLTITLSFIYFKILSITIEMPTQNESVIINNENNVTINNQSEDVIIESSKIYGTPQNPRGRIVALVKNQDPSNLKARWSYQKNGINTVTVYSKNKQIVSSLPVADLDGDLDVDEDDLRKFKNNPIDMNLNGVIDSDDHEFFKAWIGWKAK